MRSLLFVVAAGFVSLVPSPAASATLMRGVLGIHDPSTVIKCNDRYYVFRSHNGIMSRSSSDKVYWVSGPSVFASRPSWTTNYASNLDAFWAPDIIYTNGQYYLYYSVSSWASQVSAIGLATNPTLDPTDPNYQWTDQGPVIQSTNGSPYNTIDPSVARDASGNLWMAFGSFWNGINVVQLDPVSGKRIATNSPTYHVAYNSSIEAACLHHRGSYYYLFVNHGTCCDGMESTYNIRVGRSTDITGPYRDRNGVNMVSSGGTLFLKTTGKYIGPGHMGILEEGGTNWFGYHYYDGNANGAPTFDFEPLSWTTDGWPMFTNDWSAVYRFQSDARDDNGQYYGLLQNGAGVRFDSARGAALELNGSNQFVSLPCGGANGRTFAAVFKWNGGADWQRVFDFGRGTNKYAFLTPRAANGALRFAITSAGTSNERVLDGTGAAPVGAWTHVAVTTDGSRGILYVNGTPVATNTSMTLTVPDMAPTNVWFGRSQFANDPYFNGQLGSIRIFGRALSPDEIIAPQPLITAPLTGWRCQPGDTVQFAGAATDFADVPLSVTGLTWTVEFHDAGVTNLVFGPLAGVGGGSYTIPSSGPEATNGFHRILLVAADTLGRTATNSVDVFPGPTNADWAAFYPFDNGAADANGLFDGALWNGASTPADPIRGRVLNLSGASQYVSLPSGVGDLRTFAAWVKWGGGGMWQRIFDFGSGTSRYAMLTTRANNGALRFEITAAGSGERRWLDAPNPLPTNRWTHVAVTLDGRQAVMFVNGQAVAVNASVNLLPSDVAGSANYIGRSQFVDPYFNGQMDSVQMASRCLTVEEITVSRIGITNGAAGVALNWPAWTNGLALHSATNLAAGASWTPVTNAPITTNGLRFLTLSPTNSQEWFRLQLP